MSRANTPTLLPLDRFFAILGIHPLHANGVYVPELAEMGGCSSGLVQYAWQNSDAIGREDIAYAIAEAERQISDYLGFKPLASWEVDERHVAPAMGTPIKADWGYAISGGVEKKTGISVGEGVIYDDLDSDTYYETATIIAPTDVTDTNEIAVYYPGHFADDAWEIRPLKSVTVSGGLATITLRREQLVREELFEAFQPSAINGLTDENFLDTVDVYRHWHDPSQQVQLLRRGGGCNCAGINCCSACVLTGEFGCTVIASNRLSIFNVESGTWDADSQTFARSCGSIWPADRVRLWYRAGWRAQGLDRPVVQMDPQWERAIAYFAVSLLDRPLCSCSIAENLLNRWREDLAMRSSDGNSSSSFSISKDVQGNPFGTSRGAVFAWRACQRERIGQAVCVV